MSAKNLLSIFARQLVAGAGQAAGYHAGAFLTKTAIAGVAVAVSGAHKALVTNKQDPYKRITTNDKNQGPEVTTTIK